MRRERYSTTLSAAYLVTGPAQLLEMLFYYFLFRLLAVEEVGFYSWVMAVMTFFGLSLDLGMRQVLVREFATGEIALGQAVRGVGLTRLPMIVLGLIALQLWWFLARPPAETYWVMALAGFLQILLCAQTVFLAWLRAHQRQNMANIIEATGSLGRFLVAVVLLALCGLHSLLYLLGGLALVRCLSVAMGALAAYRTKPQTPPVPTRTRSLLSRMWKVGAVFAILGVVSQTQARLDWLLVSSLASTAALANYALANKLYEILLLLIGISFSTIYPWLCQATATEGVEAKLSLLMRLTVLGGTTAALSLLFLAPPALRLLFGHKYIAAEPVVRLMMLAASLIAPCALSYFLLIARGLEVQIVSVSLVAMAGQIVTDLLLIPRLGALGAAGGMIALLLVVEAGYMLLVYRKQLMSASEVVRVLLFTNLMPVVAALLYLSDIPSATGAILLLVGILTAAYLLLFSVQERQWLLAWRNERLSAEKGR
ncbi:MAG: oligosaccharide flippase family protein [Pseudomonadota bacterium]